jgi:intracellular septation protein A
MLTIVVIACVFVAICVVWREMSDLAQLATFAGVIVAVIGGIGLPRPQDSGD